MKVQLQVQIQMLMQIPIQVEAKVPMQVQVLVLVHFHDLSHCCHKLHVYMCVDTNLVHHVAAIYFVQLCNRCIFRFTTVNVHFKQAHL